MALKIRERHRRGYVREAGRHMDWTEVQVVDGRRVLSRHDLKSQAEAAIREIEAPEPERKR